MAAAAAAALAITLTGWAGTAAADPPGIVVAGGEFVPSDFDSDGDGVTDVIAMDIMRPAASDQGLKVPVIMDASPYYSTLGRGNEAQLKVDGADGLLAQWPLFLDNSFVPRGSAVALVDMTGTNHSTGCPTVQGYTDNQAAVMAQAPVSGAVPATLALTSGAPATFGAFTPGVAHTYTATTTADVVSTAGDAQLSVPDPGHLANGAFTLAQPLQVDVAPASWPGPVSHATSLITFTQPIAANELLRTGTYAKT
jgi:X-Pro dipeptidyl-peptidase (S15 family)